MPHVFFMVSVDAHPGSSARESAPTKRYDDENLARKEAERLAAKEGRRVYLLQAIAVAEPPPPVWAALAATPTSEPQS